MPKYTLKKADALVFENPVMEQRVKKLYKTKKTTYIKPSFNFSVKSCSELKKVKKRKILTGLFFCGWQLNKNIMIIPKLCHLLRKQKLDFRFILTAPLDNSKEHKNFVRMLNKYQVLDMVEMIGQVQKDNIPDLYSKVDYVFLLSKLESFSNTILETWYFKKLLIASDELWSNSICLDAAVYVNRDSAAEISKKIISLYHNPEIGLKVIKNGSLLIKTYPNIGERIYQELNYVKDVYEKY